MVILKGNFFKGRHTTLGNVKVENVVKEYANGVYDAKIFIPNPKAFKDPNAKPFLEKEGREKLVLRDINNSLKGK